MTILQDVNNTGPDACLFFTIHKPYYKKQPTEHLGGGAKVCHAILLHTFAIVKGLEKCLFVHASDGCYINGDYNAGFGDRWKLIDRAVPIPT